MGTVLNRTWSRPWVRRLTYVLAAGAALTGLTAFVVSRSATDRWILDHLDAYVQGETGLAFQAERLEVHPIEGRILLHHLSLGEDLFRADLLEVQLEWRSLVRQPHLKTVRLLNPDLRVDPKHLAGLRLKDHPPSGKPLKVRLDRLEIRGGQAQVAEPAWGIPAGAFTFQVDGRGRAANQIRLEVRLGDLSLGEGKARLQGEAFLKGEVTKAKLDLGEARVRLGRSRLAVAGSFTFASRELRAEVSEGSVALAEVLALAVPGSPQAASGTVTFNGQAQGPVQGLRWKLQAAGQDLRAKGLPLHPGTLQAKASGLPGKLDLESFQWQSQDGKLTAQGGWTRTSGMTVALQAEGIALAPVASLTRTDAVKELQASFAGKATLPGAPWDPPRMDRLTFKGDGHFLLDGERVGNMVLSADSGRVSVTELRLDLPEVEVSASASAVLARSGIERLDANGTIHTDASEVATALRAWDIGLADADHKLQAYDMAGQAQTTARFSWSRGEGIQLQGHVDTQQPRWHGARADTLSADVTIDRNELRVSTIRLAKGIGTGSGDLWLTWADLPRGAESLDMCYQFDRLPIHEGLRAADQGDLSIEGTGSGWVRLHGPFDRIQMEGQGVAEASEVYGFTFPAASTDFSMDLASMRLKATDARVADTLDHLAPGAAAPTGALALMGSMDMDIEGDTWVVALSGAADSMLLGLPGPHTQAQVDAHLAGPITSPWGPYQLPTGTLELSQGLMSQGSQSLGGLQASFSFNQGRMGLQVGLEGMPKRMLSVDALQASPRSLSGTVRLDLGPESADTPKLASELSQQFLKDAQLIFQAQGSWGPEGLNFTGSLDHLLGRFEGFRLVQARPGRVDGDGSGVLLNLDLEGHTGGAQGPEATAPVTSMTLEGGLPFSPSGPLSLQVNGSADMANLKTIVDHIVHPGQYSLLADMHPGGMAQVNLHLGGTPLEATLDGTLNLKQGRVSVSTYPQSIENVDFTAHFKGRDITIDEAAPLTGTLAQGALKAWGKATWQASGASRYDLHAKVEDFQLRDIPEGFELLGTLDATLTGTDLDGGLLKGTLWAKRVDYHADINLADILLANAGGTTPALLALDPSDPLARIDLDLDLHLAEPWEVNTNILTLRGRPDGPFRVMGTLAQPGLKGKMDFLPGGRVTNLLPTDVVLERGSLEFKDPTQFNPNVDLQGRVDVPPYLVMLGLTGTLDHLQVSTNATPSLRQDEIFAILIDPDAAATVGTASAFSSQGTLNTGLASSSTGLISSLALANFQESLRKTLSLDRVNVAIRSSLGVADTEVTIGKSYDLLGYRVPVVLIHRKEGDVTTVSGQLELRLGNFVLQIGGSQTTGTNLTPSGEIRHSWSPK